MAATYDVITVAEEFMYDRRHKCPAKTLAFLIGMSAGRFSTVLAREVPLSGDQELKLRNAIADLKKLAELCDPLPLNMSEAVKLEKSLELMRSGVLKVTTVDARE